MFFAEKLGRIEILSSAYAGPQACQVFAHNRTDGLHFSFSTTD
jgi:hypothetical protein